MNERSWTTRFDQTNKGTKGEKLPGNSKTTPGKQRVLFVGVRTKNVELGGKNTFVN